jgi:hypothetical protein
MFQTKFVKKIKTHILFLKTFFQNCAVYETMLKNTAQLETTQMIIKHGACTLHVG